MAEIVGTEIGANTIPMMEGGAAGSYYQYSGNASFNNVPSNLISIHGNQMLGGESTEIMNAATGIGGETSYQSMSYLDQVEGAGSAAAAYETSAYTSGAYGAGAYGAGYGTGVEAAYLAGGAGITGSATTEEAMFTSGGSFDASGYGLTAGAAESSMAYGMSGAAAAGGAAVTGALLPLSSYKIQVDPNPTIVRRMLSGVSAQYRQNIMVRFLKPPAPPAPGPLIIKEVRPPQPRPAPPLIIRQRPPRPKTPPPLVLRERPPRMPKAVKTQVVIKKLSALPPPPRQVIIERYPPLPPKPRDVIIERWLQYGPLPKRRVIYQRAAKSKAYKTAKNVIVQYTLPKPQVQRVFQRLGVVDMNPMSYLGTYGASLLDSASLVTAARTAGVIENIAPPALVYPSGTGMAGVSSIEGAAAITTAGYEAGAAGLAGYENISEGAMITESATGGGLGYSAGYSGAAFGSSVSEASGLMSYGAGAEFESLAGANQFEYPTVGGGGVSTSSFEESSIAEAQMGGMGMQSEFMGAGAGVSAAEGMSSYEASSFSETVA